MEKRGTKSDAFKHGADGERLRDRNQEPVDALRSQVDPLSEPVDSGSAETDDLRCRVDILLAEIASRSAAHEREILEMRARHAEELKQRDSLLTAMENTLSWRSTRLLRAIRYAASQLRKWPD